MHVCLGLLAGSTAFHIVTDEVGETRPPKFHSDQLAGLQETRVPSSGVIVVVGNNGLAEVEVIRDIHRLVLGM